jgi:hypothetical protein
MCVSQSQFMQDSPSGLSNVSHKMLIQALPPVLVLHLNRVRYDATAGSLMKIGKSIQFRPELEIPLGMIFSFVAIAGTEYFVILSFRHYGTQSSTTIRATALQALPSQRICRQWTLCRKNGARVRGRRAARGKGILRVRVVGVGKRARVPGQ